MHTKQKGDITETQVLADLVKRGLKVLTPYGENHRYDFVVDFNGKFVKIQCKTGRWSRGGISFSTCSVVSNFSKDSVRRAYTADEVDLFAVYYEGVVYYIPQSNCGSSEFRLRLTAPKNSWQRYNKAEDFKIWPDGSIGTAGDL